MARILVVDDDPAVRQMIQQVLSGQDHEVLTATDGMVAERVLKGTSVDLVITDIYMPGTDGFELIRRLRRKGSVGRILAISGGHFESPMMLQMAKMLGADRQLAKPFSLGELQRCVEELLIDLRASG